MSIRKRFHEEFVPRLAEVTEEELCTGGTAGQGRPFPPLCLANEPSYLNEEQHWKSPPLQPHLFVEKTKDLTGALFHE